MEITAKPDIN